MNDRIKRTQFYIQQNIADPISLEQLADVACLSPHHFHRLFKAEVGKTPKEYVAETRLKHIAHMLIIHKELSVTDFAFDFGYSSPAAFTRAFKALYGMGPRAFREQQWLLHKDRLAAYWASLKAGESAQPRPIKLQHMAARRLKAKRIIMQEKAVNAAYQDLIMKNQGRASHGITLYTESPFIQSRDAVRLYIALDETMGAAAGDDILDVQAGYYMPVPLTGNFEVLTDTLFTIYQRDIEPSAYRVASTIFFERVRLPDQPEGFDYFTSDRTLHACLVRR